jgi:hypothetical protein
MAPDDEVAVLHGPAPEYQPITEALVDIREFLGHLEADAILSKSQTDWIVEELAHRWFGERTRRVLVDLCETVAGSCASRLVKDRLAEFSRYRVKTADLTDFLEQEPWRNFPCPR